MNIIIKTNNTILTPDLENRIKEKLGGMNRFVKEDGDRAKIEVKISKTTKHHRHGDVFRADINFNYRKEHYYASATEQDLIAALDRVSDELVSVVVAGKDRKMTLLRRGSKIVKDMMKGLVRRK